MKQSFILFLSFLSLSLSAQQPLISLLGSPMDSKEVQDWLGGTAGCVADDASANEVAMYSCQEKGIQVEAENGNLTWIMVFADGAEYEEMEWAGYEGELPYGLKMTMTRDEVESVLGKPKKMEGFSESFYNGKKARYPDQNITIYYDIPSDKTRPEDKILGIVID